MQKIVCTGAAGYVGHRLVPRLLDYGYHVVVYDTMWFGCKLPSHDRLTIIENDIRNTRPLAECFKGAYAVIHMACISNDPSFELDESLSRTINYECFEPMVLAAKEAGVARFIYASTSSVYGISDAPEVREDHPLVPITLYNTYKAKCEPLLLKHAERPSSFGFGGFVPVILRPSTICGYSERQRLDLAVNILTNLAVNSGNILVHGGEQMRPNLHIEDMVDAYMTVLQAQWENIYCETFNVGAQNASIMELAFTVRDVVQSEYSYLSVPSIEVTESVDPRSYQVNSDKIRDSLGFVPRLTVKDAVRDLCNAFKANKLPNSLDDDRYFNVRRMHKVFNELYKDAPPSDFDPARGHLSEVDVMHRQQR